MMMAIIVYFDVNSIKLAEIKKIKVIVIIITIIIYIIITTNILNLYLEKVVKEIKMEKEIK